MSSGLERGLQWKVPRLPCPQPCRRRSQWICKNWAKRCPDLPSQPQMNSRLAEGHSLGVCRCVTGPHRLGDADGYSFPLMNHGGYAGHSCTSFSMVQNWPCGVLFCIFQNGGQTVTLCYGNKAQEGHARHRRRGANTRGKYPINLETGSLGGPSDLKASQKGKPQTNTARSCLRAPLAGDRHLYREESRRALRESTHRPGLPVVQTPAALGPHTLPGEARGPAHWAGPRVGKAPGSWVEQSAELRAGARHPSAPRALWTPSLQGDAGLGQER